MSRPDEGSSLALFGRPVGDLSALHHRPPVSLQVVDQGNKYGGAHQQLQRESEKNNKHFFFSDGALMRDATSLHA